MYIHMQNIFAALPLAEVMKMPLLLLHTITLKKHCMDNAVCVLHCLFILSILQNTVLPKYAATNFDTFSSQRAVCQVRYLASDYGLETTGILQIQLLWSLPADVSVVVLCGR